MRNRLHILAAAVLVAAVQFAAADTISFTASGAQFSGSAGVSPTDPVITNPTLLDTDTSWSFQLTFTVGDYTNPTAGVYLFNDASAMLSFASGAYDFSYNSGAGDQIELFSNPGLFGPGTTALEVCPAADTTCSQSQLILYFLGSVTSPDTLPTDAAGLTQDTEDTGSAPFQFLLSFNDGSQTNLQGGIASASATLNSSGSTVPEPASVWLLLGALGLAGLAFRHQLQSSRS